MSTTQPFTVISIDGGAATGKSSTARGVSRALNYLHVDTGSHYRAITYALIQRGVKTRQEGSVADALTTIRLDTDIVELEAVLTLDGAPVDTADLRSDAVNDAVSEFAAVPAVRQFLFEYQRGHVAVARARGFPGLVMEGRDIGSVILPDADFRFFLFADEKTRQARRAGEGQSDSVARRDALDSTRKTAPLVCPESAIKIDTGTMALDEVVKTIAGIVSEGKGAPAVNG